VSRFPRFPDAYGERWRSARLWHDTTLQDLLDEAATAWPDKAAVVTVDERLTFADWKRRSDALAAGLLGVGLGPESIVSVQLPNWVELCLLQTALARIGAVIQPLHLVYRAREVRNMLAFCEADAVVVADRFRDVGYADIARSVRPDTPTVRELIVARPEGPLPAGEHGLDAVEAEGADRVDRLDAVAPDADRVFYLNFTSGTEGAPKGFLHTHNTLVSPMIGLGRYQRKREPDAVMLANSPMTHSFGHFATYQVLAGGITMVLVDRYRPLDILRLIDRERVTHLSGTPAHLYGIIRHDDFAAFDTSSIRQVSVGGAASSPELAAEIAAVWPVGGVSNTYGMGENIIHTRTVPTDPEDKKLHSVGRPVPGAEVRIVDPETWRDLPVDTTGEIVFRGPTLCVGYHKLPERTAETRDDEGWFYTGDLGRLDGDGYLHYVGRRKEVINRGGSKIFPKEIEDLLDEHPDVASVAVVGMPDERLGEKVAAYVTTRDGRPVDLAGVNAFLTGREVMKYNYPEVLIVLDEMPMTPTGKIHKAALSDDAATRAAGGDATAPAAPPAEEGPR
jgi:acyl-CoA synthetase (AMP-forming)/AMP-acid ligase II